MNTAGTSLTGLILKNATFVTIATFLLKGINFVFHVFVVRRLGDDRFGQYSIVLAFVGIFQIFAELGMSQYVMREVARDRSKAQTLFWNLVVLRVLLALLAMVGIPLAAVRVGYSPELVLGIFIYTVSFLLSAIGMPLAALLTADERLGYVSAIDVIAQIVFIIFGSIFLFSGLGFIWLIVASLISLLPRILIGAWALRYSAFRALPFQIDVRSWPRLVRAGLPFGIISLMLSIAFSIDTVMLSQFASEEVVGWYNVAYRLIFSLMIFFGGFQTAIVPSLSRVYVNNPLEVQRWYHASVKMILLMSLPITVGGMLTAFPLIRFLYTEEFLPAALALQILIWDVPVLMFAAFCGDMTTIITEERSAARIYTINTIANVLLNWLFIPRFGLVGAALVTVVTDVISALQFHFLLRRKLNLPNMTWVAVRISLASLLMAIPVWFTINLHLFVVILVGVVTYTVLIFAFQVLTKQELALFRRALHRLGGMLPTIKGVVR